MLTEKQIKAVTATDSAWKKWVSTERSKRRYEFLEELSGIVNVCSPMGTWEYRLHKTGNLLDHIDLAALIENGLVKMEPYPIGQFGSKGARYEISDAGREAIKSRKDEKG